MAKIAVKWSLSEFLNLIELRSQTWCFVDLAEKSGFRIPHSDAIFIYAALDGPVRIAGIEGGAIVLESGDIAIILTGDGHAVRNCRDSPAEVLEFLHSGEYVDAPVTITLGTGKPEARLLCGRLKVRWPGGQHPPAIPSLLRLRHTDALVNFPRVLEAAKGAGASAVLTRLATLLFVHAFREHPQCQEAFRASSMHDPVSRARQFIETHPFQNWTVGILARKVGMGRSNFATRFVAEVGRTPIDLLTEERMKHAAVFLEQTDLNVAEIGERIGYKSEAAFSHRFRIRFGVTPGQMRKAKRRDTLPTVFPVEEGAVLP